MRIIIFISGLPGTGKSTLKEYFDEHLIDGYRVYDFDRGKFACPEDDKDHLDWRYKQTEYWLEVAAKNSKDSIGTIIFGLSLYPENIAELADKMRLDKSIIKFGYLRTDDDERKKRLFDRDTPHHWKGEKDWYGEFEAKMEEAKSVRIDTTKINVEEAAEELIRRLLTC